MWTKDKCLSILRSYEIRVSKHLKRKRGDCPRVIRAATILLGGKKCAAGCFVSTNDIQLHHVNGNWKNYKIKNLIFLCKKCHLEIHRGCWKYKPMSLEEFFMMKRYRWTDELVDKLKKNVDDLVTHSKVSNKGEAFKAVGKIWNLKPLSVENVYYGRRGGSKNKSTRSVNLSKSCMTADEAISFWQDMKRWGITVN